MFEDKKPNKKLYPFKFHPEFKKELDIAAELECLSTTALIERELSRYLRALKGALSKEMQRRKIEQNLIKEKNNNAT